MCYYYYYCKTKFTLLETKHLTFGNLIIIVIKNTIIKRIVYSEFSNLNNKT